MKKILFILFTAFALHACKSDDNGNSKGKSISPPQWVQGTWYLEDPVRGGYAGNKGDNAITFTSKNMITKSGGMEVDFVKIYSDPTFTIKEEKKNNEYIIRVSSTQGTTSIWHYILKNGKLEQKQAGTAIIATFTYIR